MDLRPRCGVLGANFRQHRDYRYVYGPETRLSQLEGDTEVMELLKNQLPVAYGVITSHDKENGNLTLGELQFVFFLGFTPEVVNPVTEKIYKIILR